MVNKIINIKNLKGEWDNIDKEYYFPILDVLYEITGLENTQEYLNNLKKQNPEYSFFIKSKIIEKENLYGKKESIEVLNTADLLKFVQLIPSPKAEPIKQLLVEKSLKKINEEINPDLILENIIKDFKNEGYSDERILQRINTIISNC